MSLKGIDQASVSVRMLPTEWLSRLHFYIRRKPDICRPYDADPQPRVDSDCK